MYKESQLDRKNRKWFADEKSVNSLKRIKVSSGIFVVFILLK